MTDLNAVFAHAFTEALRPLYKRIEELEVQVADLTAVLETHEDSVPAPPRAAVCGAYPPKDDLFPGQEWSPCDLPWEHEGAHNSSLVP